MSCTGLNVLLSYDEALEGVLGIHASGPFISRNMDTFTKGEWNLMDIGTYLPLQFCVDVQKYFVEVSWISKYRRYTILSVKL